MLLKNGIDLFSNLISYLSGVQEFSIFVPYVKDSKFRELLEVNPNCSQVVVRWLPMDLIIGSSDIEVFDTCQEFGITLYRHPRIHLKAFSDLDSCFMGSANISERAISDVSVKNFNYELATIIPHIDLSSKIYFQNILLESALVTEEWVEGIKKQIELVNPVHPPEDFPIIEKDHFLLSSLPMTSTVKNLLRIYFEMDSNSLEELNCAAHDIALYNIPQGLERGQLIDHLDRAFNTHPFIVALKSHIANQPEKSLNYGGVVRWIQNNTTTVPTPRSWELKKQQLVNTLYDWICEFDDAFYWDRPNHSQVIYKIR